MDAFVQELAQTFGPRAKEAELLGRYTTLKIGGPARYFLEAKTVDELATAVRLAVEHSIPTFVLGGGSNILIGDRGFAGLVIKNNTQRIVLRGATGVKLHDMVAKGTVFVEADSGVPINKLVRFTIEEGLAGLEMHLGLPGSVGGAVYMNSKWTHPDGYVGDAVVNATIVTPAGKTQVVPQSYFHFAYDSSRIQTSRDIVLSVVFALKKDTKEHLWAVANDSIGYRRQSQPQGVSTAGCTFRNITKAQALAIPTPGHTTSAGYLIDHAGLKGTNIGDAQISPMHANFIINTGHATAAHVVELIELARKKVKDQFGVTLEEEVVRIGDF